MFRTSLLMLAGMTVALATADAQAGDRALRDTLEARSLAFYKSSGTPGLAVGVWKDARVLYAKRFGERSHGEGKPITPRTVFHMASISKTFVATAILQLVEAGRVKLDDPYAGPVPYFQLKDPRSTSITVRQLLTHTAGMPDVSDYHWDTPEYDDGALDRWIRGLRDSTPIAAPGEKWEYSNIGFEALAHLVAVVSGETFEGYVKRHLLAPAGMVHSTFLMTDVDSANLALGHESSPTGLRRAYPYNRRHAGSSTMHSSVEDMLRYGAIHAARGAGTGPQLLSPATYDEMWKGQRDISEPCLGPAAERGNARSAQMGLGWFLLDVDGQRVMSHDGADRGFRTAFLVSPDRHVVVVVFANSTVSVCSLAIPLLGAVLR